ncbi:MAG: YrhA family protein [Bacteroidales bacterium]|jgi:hypothetical protein|nr:YrhA family protein [Bacteroidales bacterium]
MEPNEARKITEKILATLDHSAMIPRVATDADIAQCNADLESLGLPLLPDDYVSFLQSTCGGLAWNGIEIYGTDIVSDPASSRSYQLMDIVTKTDEGDDRYWERIETDCIYFGRSDEEVFTYNTETKKYEARDLSDISFVYEAHDTIYAFINAVVGGRLGYNN